MVTNIADGQLSKWLSSFNQALLAADIDALATLFHPDAFWRDLLALTWNIHTAEGQDSIRAMLDTCLARAAPAAWLQMGPAHLNDEIVEGVATFETRTARCHAVVRLRQGKAWTVLTSVADLKPVGNPSDRALASKPLNGNAAGSDWPRDASAAPAPYCVVVGAGQCGLALGVQLQRFGVPTLLIDRRERPSDTWRERHDGLALHSPSYFDRMPGFPYPEDWPLHPSKDQFADWLDAYQSVMNLDVWTGTECMAAEFDDARNMWRLQVSRGGRMIELNPRQLVVATGIFGAAKIPDVAGKERFAGVQQHAGWYRGGRHHAGRRCVVVGSGTTAHDVCADLCAAGADVTMIQRSP